MSKRGFVLGMITVVFLLVATFVSLTLVNTHGHPVVQRLWVAKTAEKGAVMQKIAVLDRDNDAIGGARLFVSIGTLYAGSETAMSITQEGYVDTDSEGMARVWAAPGQLVRARVDFVQQGMNGERLDLSNVGPIVAQVVSASRVMLVQVPVSL